jgi:hypothetical protein
MEEVDWIDMALDRKKWQPLASAVMKIQVPYN